MLGTATPKIFLVLLKWLGILKNGEIKVSPKPLEVRNRWHKLNYYSKPENKLL